MRHEVRQSSAFGRRLGHRKISQHRKRVGQQNLGSYLRTNQILAQSVWHTLCQGAGEYTARRDTSQITVRYTNILLCIISTCTLHVQCHYVRMYVVCYVVRPSSKERQHMIPTFSLRSFICCVRDFIAKYLTSSYSKNS